MRRILLALFLFCAVPSAHAAYVQSSKTNFATAASTACTTGSVTSGNVELMFVQANSNTSVTISSTQVTTWVQQEAFFTGSTNLYLWTGIVTSSGSDTVTVSYTSGTGVIGSTCLEYSSTTIVNAHGHNVTTVSVTTSVAV